MIVSHECQWRKKHPASTSLHRPEIENNFLNYTFVFFVCKKDRHEDVVSFPRVYYWSHSTEYETDNYSIVFMLPSSVGPFVHQTKIGHTKTNEEPKKRQFISDIITANSAPDAVDRRDRMKRKKRPPE